MYNMDRKNKEEIVTVLPKRSLSDYTLETMDLKIQVSIAEERSQRMLFQREDLKLLFQTINNWLGYCTSVERYSHGNPSLRSTREMCTKIKQEIDDIEDIINNLAQSDIPGFDIVRDLLERVDGITDSKQPNNKVVEDLRACLGEASGYLEAILNLLYL